ncbi:MAG: hypothetical protein MJZ81_09285 [Bacteroidales bacterium]|nr:hypothetical protein [Bacteroidales bacterium]
MKTTEYRRWTAVVNGFVYSTVAKTEKKAKANIRFQAARNGLCWLRSADIEVREIA